MKTYDALAQELADEREAGLSCFQRLKAAEEILHGIMAWYPSNRLADRINAFFSEIKVDAKS